MKDYEVSVYKTQLVRESILTFDAIRNSDDAAEIFRSLGLVNATQEHLAMVAVNVKGDVIGAFIISVGDLSSASISPRDIFQRAILSNAAGIIIAHNHPSGDPHPSDDDILATNRLAEAGKVLGIPVIDHIIIGGMTDDIFSFKAEGLMP